MLAKTWGKTSAESSLADVRSGVKSAGVLDAAVFRSLALGCFVSLSSASYAKGFKADDVLFDIPEQRADQSLIHFAEQANLTLIFPFDLVRKRRANELIGEYSIQEAVRILLSGTGLKAKVSEDGRLTIMIDHSLGEKNPMYKKKKLSSAIVAVMASMFGANQVAAQDGAGEMEEVFVTGIRASIQRAMDIKRDSDGVVDSISAEDIGKFPDSNIAESLQRITGVSISRRNGEGSQVTVRGFGPDYNMITLNGRTMPASSLNQNGGGDNASRAFDMDNIASEGINGVDVYKTGKANIASGGIGATINLKTYRPIENPGFSVNVGAKLLKDETNRVGDDITPELSGLISWADDNQELGLSLSFSRQDRDSAASGAYVSQWSANQAYTGTYPLSVPTDGTVQGPATVIENEPAIGEIVGNPSDLRYFHADRERTRTNAQLTLQFSPNENITGTLDYTYAEQEIFENRSELSVWFQDFPRTNLLFDDGVSPTPIYMWEESRDPTVGDPKLPRDIGLALQQQNQVNKLESLGFNLAWQFNDTLSFNFDVHNSSSESLPNADFGNWINTGLGANVSNAQGADWSLDLPVILIDFNDTQRPGLNPNSQLDKSEVGSSVRQLSRNSSVTDIFQIKLDGRFDFDDGESGIDFGMEVRNMENRGRTAFDQTELVGGWGISNPGDVPAKFLEPINYAELFDNYGSNSNDLAWFADASDGAASPLVLGYTGDAAKIGRVLAENANLPFSTDPLLDTTNRIVKEDIEAIYFQFDLNSNIGEMPVSILTGLRYEGTTVTSTSVIALPTVRWESNNDFSVQGGDPNNPQNFSKESTYSHLLPSLDIAVDVREDMVARVSYGKTIGRTTYNNLSTAATIFGGPSLPSVIDSSVPGTASSGDPGVLPLESDNFDVSFEWYYGDASYASIGYFDKRVNNFVGIEATPANVYGIRDPSNGPRVQAAIAQLEADGIAVDATSIFSMVAAQTAGEPYASRTAEQWEQAYDFVGDESDPLMIFTTQVPKNINDARVSGIEIAGQHFFGDSGWGVQANYTFVDGDVEFDLRADPQDGSQFALPGLSDTANASLFYDKDRLTGRISYNWRDKFLDNPAVNGNEPQFTREYSQIDLNVSYEVLDDLFVSFEGINVTGEDQRQYGRSERQLKRIEILGPRYALGVRYSF